MIRVPSGMILLLCLNIGCQPTQDPQGAKARPAPHVVVTNVKARDVPIEVRAPVDLRALVQVDVGSKIFGYVDAILVERGDAVKKGQLLAVVRPSDLPEQLAAARGSIAQIQAQATLARTNFERASKLAPAGVVSQQELQAATTALATAQAAEAAAESQISGIAIRLGETRILSPIAGLISARRVDPGALVGPPGNSMIVTVIRTDRMRVFITLTESDALGIHIGMDAHVELDAIPEKRFPGKVVRVAPSFDPLTRTLDAEIQLENKSGELRPGMYGRGSIIREIHANVPVISVNAVQITGKQRYVFILQGSKVARRAVEVGAELEDGTMLEIKSGLRPGEDVVIAGSDGLADGATVRVARDVNPFTGPTAVAPKTPAAN